MNSPGLFLAGAFVTLILVCALVLLSYAAILDGRYADAQKLVAEDEMRSRPEPAAYASVNSISSVGEFLAAAPLGDSPNHELLVEPTPAPTGA